MQTPQDFNTYTQRLMGEELFATYQRALDEDAPVSIRVNPFKANANPFKQDFDPQPVPWCSNGFYLDHRPAFTFDPLLHAGLYYVQEASSMFVCEVVRQLVHEPVTMLDLCAAPGGKSTALRSVLPDGSLLFTNEPVKQRASILKENVEKFGHPDVVVTNNYPRDYRKAGIAFDAILADVPCSGEGMFRKDAGAIGEWSVQNVEKCRQLQRSIIEDIWPCLRPGGLLIYSTCTFNAHEDEENVAWIAENLGADFVEVDTRREWNITGALTGSNPVYRFISGRTKGEGLFMAVLRKRDDGDDRGYTNKKSSKHSSDDKRSSKAFDGKCSDWVGEGFSFFEDKDFIRAIPSRWADIYNKVKGKLHIIHAGVGIGTVKGRDIVPDASLALSIALNGEAFPHVELSYDDTIRFLRKEAVALPSDTPRGFTLITYKGHPLGFEKNIGNRANNLYPQEWKIKSQQPASYTASEKCR